MSNLILTRKSVLITPKDALILPRGPRGVGLASVRGPHFSPNIINPYRFGVHVPGSGYGFSPMTPATPKVWWRADAGLTLAGSDVSIFGDQSGNANDGTWTGSRAQFESNVTGSLPAVHFQNASLGGKYLLPTNCMSGVTEAQIFLAIKCTENTPAAEINTGLMDWSAQGTTASHYSFTDGNIYDGFGSATRYSTGNPSVDLSTWHRLCIKAQASGYQLWINNASHFSNATSSGSNWISVPQFGVSKKPGAADYRFNGYLLEMIVYASVLDSTNRGLVDTYLADRISGVWYAA